MKKANELAAIIAGLPDGPEKEALQQMIADLTATAEASARALSPADLAQVSGGVPRNALDPMQHVRGDGIVACC
jgi:hypothetical protein